MFSYCFISFLRPFSIPSQHFSYYLIQLYLPSGMLVVVSWVSFWLDKVAFVPDFQLILIVVAGRSPGPRIAWRHHTAHDDHAGIGHQRETPTGFLYQGAYNVRSPGEIYGN